MEQLLTEEFQQEDFMSKEQKKELEKKKKEFSSLLYSLQTKNTPKVYFKIDSFSIPKYKI